MEDRGAETNEKIREFVDLVKATTDGRILTFAQVESRPFMKFWQNFIICRYVEEKDDFLVIFFGTDLERHFGRDSTGKFIRERKFDQSGQSLRDAHMDAMKSSELSYGAGDLKEESRDFKIWHQVKMALKRGDVINETLSFIVFD